MAHAPNNPNVEKAADIPYDRDSVSPLPQFAPRARGAGAGRSHTQNAPAGELVEPGRVEPSKGRDA